jgi:MFS family permease
MLTSYLQKMRLFSRNVRLLLVAAAFDGFVMFGIMGVVFNLYLLRLGYGPKFIGLVWAVQSVSWAVFSLPAGMLGSRWGIRRTMTLGLSIVPLAAVSFPFTQSLPEAVRPAWLIVFSMVWGMGFVTYLVNVIPYLTAATRDTERAHAFSVWLALIPFAGFVGALVAGWLPGAIAGLLGVSLDSPEPFRYPLWLGAVLFIPSVGALLATSEVTAGGSPTARRKPGRAPVALLAVLGTVILLNRAAAAAPQSFFNVYLDDALGVSPARIGTLTAVAQLSGAVAVLIAPILMGRHGKRRTNIWAFAGTAVSLLPLALIPHWAAAGLGYAGMYAGAMIVDAAYNIFAQESVAPDWRPTMAGVTFAAEGVSRTLVAALGGLAIVEFGYRTMFLIVAVVAAAASVVFWAYFRGPRGEPPAAS